MNEAARWLKKMRGDMSFRDLEKLVKVNHTSLAQAEGTGKATVGTWIKLAEHYGESVLKVLYWAKKMKHPPSDSDVVLELQNRIIVQMVETFPENEWESVLKRLALEVEDIHEKQKETTGLNHSVRKIVEGLPFSKRLFLMGKVFIWMVSYHLSHFPKFEFTLSRARVHWLGRLSRRRRPERALFSALLISSVAFFELGEYMIWAVMWGGALSIFVTLNSIYLLIPRKRAHWVRQL